MSKLVAVQYICCAEARAERHLCEVDSLHIFRGVIIVDLASCAPEQML